MSVDETDLSRLLSSAGLVVLGQVLYSVSKLLERIVIARALSPDAYGEVSIGIALMGVCVTVALVGFKQGVPRFVSRYDDPADVRGVWLTALLVPGSLAVLVAIALLLNVEAVSSLLLDTDGVGELIVPFALAIPFVVGLEVGIGAIRGLENTVYRTISRDLLYPFARLALLVALLSAGVGVVSAGYAYLAAAILAFAAAHVLLNRLIPLVGRFETHPTELLVFSLPLVLSTVLSMLLTQTDTLMLGYFRPSYEVGLYDAAFPLSSGLLLVVSSFGFMYLPLVSKLDAGGEVESIDAVYKLTTKWIFVVTFPLFLTLVVFPGDVLSMLFGSQYADAAPALAILSIGFFTSAAFGRNKETVQAMGRTKYLLVTNGFAFALNLVLNLVLIPRYGFVGAAVASAASFGLLNVLVSGFLRVTYGISPLSRWTVRSYVVLPVCLVPPSLLLAEWVSLTVIALPLFLAAAAFSTVVVLCVAGCLQSEDRIALQFVEDLVGVRLTPIRWFLPDARADGVASGHPDQRNR